MAANPGAAPPDELEEVSVKKASVQRRPRRDLEELEKIGGIVPADLLSRVVVNEGAEVYLDKSSLETSGSDVDLTLATPVLIESSGSSSQAIPKSSNRRPTSMASSAVQP